MNKTLYPLSDETERNLDNKYFVFDIETQGLKATPESFLFCCIYSKNYKKTCFSVAEIKKELLHRRYRGKYVFAHNAEFDLTGIYGNILKFLDQKAIFNGKFICATNGVCTFADSHNIIQGSVASIGESIGIKKTLTYEILGKGNVKRITQKMIEGCFRDCEIIYKALNKIFNYCGELKLTIGSLSMNYFRRKFLNDSIQHSDKYDEEFFSSYYGGRVEAFKLGLVNAWKYDFNSMYPCVMKDIILPHPNYLKKVKPTVQKFLKHFLNKEGLISCSVNHAKNNFGYLPLRKNDEVIFPNGNFSGVWNLNEFRKAYSSGLVKIKKIYYVVYSDVVIKKLFTEFIETLYKKRLESKSTIDKIIFKNLQNNLYGKFGTKTKPKTQYIHDIDESEELLYSLETSGTDYKLIKTGEGYYLEIFYNHKEQFSIPSFASYITSAARVKLIESFEKYKDYKIVYCDTDSIAVQKKLPLEQSLKLGELKLEKEKILEIKGNKHYIELKEKKITLKLKGVPKKHHVDKEGFFVYQKMIKTKEGLRRGKESGIFEIVKKKITKVYSKRLNNKPINL